MPRTSGKGLGPLLVNVPHDGAHQCAMESFHEAIGCGMLGGRPGEVYTTQLRQAVEKLRLELASLVGGDCLWTA